MEARQCREPAEGDGVTMRVKHHSKGYAALLKHPNVQADLYARAVAVSSAAGGPRDGFYPASSGNLAAKMDDAGRLRDSLGRFAASGLRSRARAAVVAPRGDSDNKMIHALDAGR